MKNYSDLDSLKKEHYKNQKEFTYSSSEFLEIIKTRQKLGNNKRALFLILTYNYHFSDKEVCNLLSCSLAELKNFKTLNRLIIEDFEYSTDLVILNQIEDAISIGRKFDDIIEEHTFMSEHEFVVLLLKNLPLANVVDILRDTSRLAKVLSKQVKTRDFIEMCLEYRENEQDLLPYTHLVNSGITEYLEIEKKADILMKFREMGLSSIYVAQELKTKSAYIDQVLAKCDRDQWMGNTTFDLFGIVEHCKESNQTDSVITKKLGISENLLKDIYKTMGFELIGGNI